MYRRRQILKIKDFVTLMVLVAGLALLNWLFPEPHDAPKNIAGRTRVIDGDSLYVDAYEVRLLGIDAPEGRQMCRRRGVDWPCGRQSADRLRALIGRQRVNCQVEKHDKHRRLLAICEAGRKNLNLSQVKNGWAVSYGRYSQEERMARDEKRGIWSGTFEHPKDWRDKNM